MSDEEHSKAQTIWEKLGIPPWAIPLVIGVLGGTGLTFGGFRLSMSGLEQIDPTPLLRPPSADLPEAGCSELQSTNARLESEVSGLTTTLLVLIRELTKRDESVEE
jgi:hypothetical protein